MFRGLSITHLRTTARGLGNVVDVARLRNVVDILPAFVGLAGASTERCKPLDGLDLWPTIIGGKDSGRDEIVYNIEPFRGIVRQGDRKLVWIMLLPGKVELYNLADDPNETKNVASEQPEIVVKLKGRIEELANQSVKPLFFGAASEPVFSSVFGPAPFPTDDGSATAELQFRIAQTLR